MQGPLLAQAGGDAPQGTEMSDVCAVHWAGLSFSIRGTQILKEVSGQLEPGQLACILGPSGAGKSTLLNVLAGRQRTEGDGFAFSGSIEVGGRALTPRQMRKRVAFVMQDEALMPTQTVRETLLFSASLRLPGSSKAERAANVDKLLSSLGLLRCADTVIGSALVKGISGGERKRCSVGIELITGPSMVFLDEPTTGLDSFAAHELVGELRSMTQSGKVVCCTIHQPSSDVFAMFDHVMCLRKGEMYFSSASSSLLRTIGIIGHPCPHGYNAADWLLRTAQTLGDDEAGRVSRECEATARPRGGDPGVEDSEDPRDQCEDQLYEVDLLQQHQLTERRSTDSASQGSPGSRLPAETARASLCTQLACLVRREAQSFWRDKKSRGSRLGMILGQSLLFALIFVGVAKSTHELEGLSGGIADCAGSPMKNPASCRNQWLQVVGGALADEYGVFVSISIAAFFGAVTPLLLAFSLERPVFLREYSSNMYSVFTYFVAKTAIELCVTLAQNVVMWVILFYACGFRSGAVGFALLVGSTWLLAAAVGSMALWAGCSVSSASSAVQLTPALAVPQILFSGLFLPVSRLPVYLRWVQYVCSLKYAINLMCVIEYSDLELVGPDGSTYSNIGDKFLERQDIQPDHAWLYVGVNLAIFVVFRFLALLALRRKGQYVF